MNVGILIAAFIISFVFISIWSFKLGKSKLKHEIFGNAEEIIHEALPNKNELSFMGIVYDLNSPTYKHIKNVPNPHNIDIDRLMKLKNVLLDNLNTNLNDTEKNFILGQLDILNKLSKTHIKLN